MRSLLFSLCLLGVALLLAPAAGADESAATASAVKPFELLDGDRVVFLGGTFFEREAKWGYIETALTSRFPDRNVTFRNLGYAGDTVRCEARTVCEGWDNFGPPQEGFDRLKTLIAEIKPTVIFVAYGMGESFEGEKALPQFVADYKKLLDMLNEASGTKPRFVLIGPNYHEDLGRPLPEPGEHNRLLKMYSDAIGKIASERFGRYVDLLDSLRFKPGDGEAEVGLTDDGVHLTQFGYQHAAATVVTALCGRPRPELEIDASGKVLSHKGLAVTDVKVTDGQLAFGVKLDYLPLPAAPVKLKPPDSNVTLTGDADFDSWVFVLRGLAEKQHYLLRGSFEGRDDRRQGFFETQSAGSFSIKFLPEEGHDTLPLMVFSEQAEELRQLIVAKNADYFRYWRHENDTYTLGYRKHEQGKNAAEFPEFVKLAEEKDKEIAKLRVPRAVSYTLEREDRAGK